MELFDALSWTWLDTNTTVSVGSMTFTLLAIILPLFVFGAYKRYQYANRQPFRFLDLPQELRDMVYENLIEDPFYPPPEPCVMHCKTMWLLPGCTASAPRYCGRLHGQNQIFLANKQLYQEYMDMICKRTTFHLTVSPRNYPAQPQPGSASASESLWSISKDTLHNLRTCSLKLVTTAAMLGVTDPRHMASSSDWALARQIHDQLKDMPNMTSLTLDAKALGDPLWNPLWIWFHASQSFKAMRTLLSDTMPAGPRLTRITFSLDTWSPGQNYLQRDAESGGAWMWHCPQGHAVGLDKTEMTVREFCGRLYEECDVCNKEGGAVSEREVAAG